MTDPFPAQRRVDQSERPAAAAPPGAGDDALAWPPLRRLGPAGRYHLEERIAAGGAATVWRAYDEQLDRSVAIKILHPHLVGDEDTVRRFERESRNAARLHHPNAIRIFDSGRVNDVVYLVMEYVDGPTLKEVLAQHGALNPWQVVAAIGEQIATALAEAHAQALIHRDIKPANILFTTDGIVKVVDFGIAKALSGQTTDLTAEGTTVGTATYIAPEQYTGDEVDGRVDVYALGMVMYECLTGRPAYVGDTPAATAAARLTREIVPPRQVRADVDRRLEDIVVRCTRRDPSERYADAGAVAHALRAMVSDAEPHELTRELVAAVPPPAPTRPAFPPIDDDAAATDPGLPAGPSTHSRWRIALAFLAGMAITAAVVALIAGQQDEPLSTPQFEGGDFLTITAARDYDPQGGDGENEELVARAWDGVLSTAWYTQKYRAPDPSVPFGGQKTGVGVYFDLGDARVSRILVDFLEPGTSLNVYAVDEMPEEEDGIVGWGAPIGEYDDLAETSVEIELEQPIEARYWLLWLTDIPEVEEGFQQGSLAEVRFVGEPLQTEDDGQ